MPVPYSSGCMGNKVLLELWTSHMASHVTAYKDTGKIGTAKKIMEEHRCLWPRIIGWFFLVCLFVFLLWFYNFFVKILCQKISMSEFVALYG